MERWVWWLLPPYGARRRRAQALAMVRDWQEEERVAARRRILEVARVVDQPTAIYPVVSPLLTRGQAARTGLVKR
jgi:hypothetical protein